MTDWIEEARSKFAAAKVSDDALEAEKLKGLQLENELRELQQKRESLRAAEDEDAAIRELDGDDAAPIDEKRRKQLAEMDTRMPTVDASSRKLRTERIPAAKAKAEKAKKQVTGPVLHVVNEVLDSAVDQIRGRLADLGPLFAELIAADQIRAALIGDHYTVPPGCPVPFSGRIVTQSLINAIPESMRPVELAESLLFEAAHEKSSTIIAQIKGDES